MKDCSYEGRKTSVLKLWSIRYTFIGMSLKCDLGLCIFCGVDVVKRGSELCLQLTWRRGNPCLLFSHRTQQEAVSHCLQTAEKFFYLKPNALLLKLSWEKKLNINTILVKKSSTCSLTAVVGLECPHL